MAKKNDNGNGKSMEETLWDSANKLRGTVESSEYKHVVLGLIFLKFVSDKFEERRKELICRGQGEIHRDEGVLQHEEHLLFARRVAMEHHHGELEAERHCPED
jgi:type I restriction-modification system DNA methylase subunit